MSQTRSYNAKLFGRYKKYLPPKTWNFYIKNSYGCREIALCPVGHFILSHPVCVTLQTVHCVHYWCQGHWRRLVKKLGGQPKILGGQKVVKSDKCMGDSQLLGQGHVPGCPLSLRLCAWAVCSVSLPLLISHCLSDSPTILRIQTVLEVLAFLVSVLKLCKLFWVLPIALL